MLNLIRDLRDRRMEIRDAARGDANLAQLIATDNDAALTFQYGDFTRSLNDIDGFGAEFGRRLEKYAALKFAASQMHLYHQLFA